MTLKVHWAEQVVKLYYRHVDQAERWTSTEMKKRDEYTAAIPGDYTNSAFPLQYYFELEREDAAWLYPAFNATLSNQPYYAIAKRNSTVTSASVAKAAVGFPRHFPVELGGVGVFMLLSSKQAARAAVGERHVAGNPGRPVSFSSQVRFGERWGTRPCFYSAVWGAEARVKVRGRED